MVSNIRAAFADRPGSRVLTIVGATHKHWFDALLGQMQGVDIVDVEQVLEYAARNRRLELVKRRVSAQACVGAASAASPDAARGAASSRLKPRLQEPVRACI